MRHILVISQYLFNFNHRYWLAASLLMLGGITTLSLTPLAQLPSVAGSDKTHHFIAYGLLVLPAALHQHRHLVLITLFYFMCSALIEIIQPLVNRYGEWLDLAANGGGLLTGIFVAKILCHICLPGQRTNN